MRRRAKILPVAFVTLLAMATPGEAHYVYQGAQVYGPEVINTCVYAYAQISHGSTGKGYQLGEARSIKSGTYYCSTRSTYDMAMYQILYRYGGDCTNPNNGWCECTHWGWFYWDHVTYDNDFATVERSYTYPDVPCGKGTYGLQVYAYTYVANAWRGGAVWSGSHDLPTSGNSIGGSHIAPLMKPISNLLPSGGPPNGRVPLPLAPVPV